ncbi:MAG TPA: hypothetical protein GX720_05190 [Clostridiaceae bacterium]|nr:hypothetical protein [Clostridiaceae bacterium]
MFGYVRPEKADLLIRDFTAYKAVYCGLCKSIGRRAGQIPRTAVTYDMTFFALLLLSLDSRPFETGEESCILNPLKKKSVAASHPVLDYAADVSSLLAYQSALDDLQDGRPVKGRLLAGLFIRAARKARKNLPELNDKLEAELAALYQAEKGESPFLAADIFGRILEEIMAGGLRVTETGEEDRDLLLALLLPAAGALGRWVYLIDAIHDREQDGKAGLPNPFSGMSEEEARLLAKELLIKEEETVDRHLALLTYRRFGALVYNIVSLGLPGVRIRILAGEALPAL